MVTFSRILCPVDFSDQSIRALTLAGAIARWHEAELLVLHVTARPAGSLGPDESVDDSRAPDSASDDAITARLDRALAQAGAMLPNARRLVRQGAVHRSIVACAASTLSDLLVMGTHGEGGLHRLLLGSVTEKIVRTATCPVLTVPPAAPPSTAPHVEFKRILCAIDYSPSSLRALDYALALGRQADGRVTVLHAIEYMEPPELCEHVAEDIRRTRQHFVDHARQRLHAQLAGEPRTWCAIEEVVAVDRAYKAVLSRATAAPTDLIVMGAQGFGGIELMLYGSNTHHVVRAAPCPVLTVR